MPAEHEEPHEKRFVEETDHGVFHQIGSVVLAHVVVPLAAEVGHEPQHVAPPGAVARRMRIAFLIAVRMMLAMVGHPNDGRAFAGQAAQERKKPPHRPVRLKTSVREQAMVAQADAQSAGKPVHADEQRHGLPGEKERSGQRTGMHDAKPNDGAPIEPALPGIGGLQRFVGPTFGLRFCHFTGTNVGLRHQHRRSGNRVQEGQAIRGGQRNRHWQSFLLKIENGSSQAENVVSYRLDQQRWLAVTNIVEILEMGPDRCVRQAHRVCKIHVKVDEATQNPRKIRFNRCEFSRCQSSFNEDLPCRSSRREKAACRRLQRW